MGRKAYFAKEQFIEAALELIDEHGPAAVTVASIAKQINAPIGSVYHRFSSRELIIAELWLGIAEEFQTGFTDLLAKGEVVNAALYTANWVRSHPREGKILLLYHREELMNGEWPDQFRDRAQDLEISLSRALLGFAQVWFGDLTPEYLDRTVLALISIPLALVKPYLAKGKDLPAHVDNLIRESCESILGGVR